MNRRDFIKLAGLAGLSVTAPWSLSSRAQAQGMEYGGPLYLILHAGGGWDPTSLCDPKGYLTDPEEEGRLNNYARDDIRSPSEPSPIRWAPFANNDAFFERHYKKLLVINGIDTATNNHSAGPRHIHSGNLGEGHPAFAALVAATHAREKPLSFITNGGYDITRGVVARTRSGNLDAIERIAFPNKLGDGTYHTDAGYEKILDAQREQVSMLQGRQRLPHLKESLSTLVLARSSNNELQKLTEFLPDLNRLDTGPGRQAALAIAAFRAGLCVSANLSTGGFDTHGDHDNRHATALSRLTNGLNEIWEEAERQEVADRIVVIVGSDFGRTPGYNDGNGKDHWPITSMLFMGAGIQGNRVVGATDDGHRPLKINPSTLEPDEGGVVIEPVQIQRELRRFAGVGGDYEAQYPLLGDDLTGLFG